MKQTFPNKLTELTNTMTKEIESLQAEHRSLLQEMTSMIAKEKALTYQIAQKELREQKLNQELTERLERINNLELLDQQAESVHRANLKKRNNELDDELKERRTNEENKWTQQEQVLAYREEQCLEKEHTVHNLDKTLTILQGELQTLQQQLDSKQKMVEDKLRDVTEITSTNQKSLQAAELELQRRGNECTRLERDLSTRSKSCVEREAICSSREDTSRMESRTSSEQLVKVTALVDSYERKIQAFAEKESLLVIRDMKLADREGVARTHGSR